MKGARIHRFGPPEVIVIDEIPRPMPTRDEVLVRVLYAGVGPWDELIREHKSAIETPLPITPGSDIAGVVEEVGSGVNAFQPGDAVYGVTNAQFIGGYAEFAVASAKMIARKPESLTFAESASAPVVAITAQQMLFDYAHARAGQSVLIHGAGGCVGAYAVQFAKQAGLHVAATASGKDVEYVRNLGAEVVVDYRRSRFDEVVSNVDVVLDMVGGETRERSYRIVKPGGIVVSVVSDPAQDSGRPESVRGAFFIVEVTAERLNALSALFDRHELVPRVGSVLALDLAREAHEMLAGAPHLPGKIILKTAA